MKYRLVPGCPARSTTTLITGGLLPRPAAAQHVFRAGAIASSTPGCLSQTRPKSTSSRMDKWEVIRHVRPSIHPHSSSSPSTAPLPMGEQLRHMMRLLPHSVVVCTSSSPDAKPRGMTVSSFTSLSLDPPLVTFHCATPSRTLDAIRATGALNFHLLSGDTRGARAAHHFTRGNVGWTWSGKGLGRAGLKVARGTLDEKRGLSGDVPVLMGSGVMYVLRCRLFDEEPATSGGIVMVRDHAIVVAEVVDIIETSQRTDGHENFGVVYADRHYRELGSTLVRTRDMKDRRDAVEELPPPGEESG